MALPVITSSLSDSRRAMVYVGANAARVITLCAGNEPSREQIVSSAEWGGGAGHFSGHVVVS